MSLTALPFPRRLLVTAATVVALAVSVPAAHAAEPAEPQTSAAVAAPAATRPDFDIAMFTSTCVVRPGGTISFLVGIRNNGPGTTRPLGYNEAAIAMTIHHGLRVISVSDGADVYPQVGDVRAIYWPRPLIDSIRPGSGRLVTVTVRVPRSARPGAVIPGYPTTSRRWPAVFTTQALVSADQFSGAAEEVSSRVRFVA